MARILLVGVLMLAVCTGPVPTPRAFAGTGSRTPSTVPWPRLRLTASNRACRWSTAQPAPGSRRRVGAGCISESIVKLFTVAYSAVKADGRPTESMASQLRTIVVQLGRPDRVLAVERQHRAVDGRAVRVGARRQQPEEPGPHDWGWGTDHRRRRGRLPLQDGELDPVVAPLFAGRDGEHGRHGIRRVRSSTTG